MSHTGKCFIFTIFGSGINSQKNFFSDVTTLDLKGLPWLENARLFKETIIGLDGKSANVTTIHPLEYAIYKNWLGQREDRDFLKHTRDIEQSKLVTKIITEYMPNIDIDKETSEMKHIPKEVVKDYLERICNTRDTYSGN